MAAVTIINQNTVPTRVFAMAKKGGISGEYKLYPIGISVWSWEC
jgi:hypothetical protein